MQTAVEALPEDKVRVRIEVPVDDVDHAFHHALSDLRRDFRAPGFRKGKAPVAIVRQRIGEEALAEEALRTHIEGWWRRGCSAAGVEGIDRPEIDWESIPKEGEPFTFTGVVAVAPKATLPADLDLAAVRPAAELDESALDAEIERLRLAGATFEVVESAVEAGQQVLVDLHGSVDGKAIKDAQAEDLLIEAGSGRLLDELDAALIGMRAGDEREVDVVLPPTQKPKRLAGKTAQFQVVVKEVRARILPDLDDAFAKSVAGFDTVDELREDIRTAHRQRVEREADGTYRRSVLADLGAQAEVDVPPSMVAARVDDRLRSMARSLSDQGIGLDQYMAMMGRDVQSLVRELMPESAREIREELALDAYADRENVLVDDAAMRTFLAEQAAEEGEPEEIVERIMGDAAMREDMRRELRLRNALDRAVETAREIDLEEAQRRAEARRGDDVEEGEAPADAPEIWLPDSAKQESTTPESKGTP